MSPQKRLRMRIGYKLFGNSIAWFLNKSRFEMIKHKIPEDFKKRSVFDLGCGDGRSSLKIKELFQARRIRGCDIEESLVRRAKKRGVDAEVMNLKKKIPKGEMATIWGVLHHLKDKESILRKVVKNFDYVVIREPIKSWWAFLDGGEPLPKDEWIELFNKTLRKYTLFQFGNDLIVFWSKNKVN